MEHTSGRADQRNRNHAVNSNRGKIEELNMRQSGPEWVFRIVQPIKFYNPPREYTLLFRKPMTPEDLYRILMVVEKEFESAFIR